MNGKHVLWCVLAAAVCVLMIPGSAWATATGGTGTATEQDKQIAIDAGLAYLANSMQTSGSEGYWPYGNNGTLAATGSAALAFIEEGYLPTDASGYGKDIVAPALNYIFNRAVTEGNFNSLGLGGKETAGYTRYAEDYNNDGILNDGGNNQAIYFWPGNASRSVYTTGIVAPVVAALGDALGKNTTVGRGPVTAGMTYKQVMRDLVDWVSYAQVEPNTGNYRGGWRYYANQTSSDNSTAQWGSLIMLYGDAWGLDTPDYVENELELWINYIQNTENNYRKGGSGYDNPTTYVNFAKTGGLLLQLAAIGAPPNDPRVVAAIDYLESTASYDHWMQGAHYSNDQWYGGHLGNPYSMWAVYKALKTYNVDTIATAPGGFTIGQDWDPQTSAAGDWYSHYSQYLVDSQNPGGSWNGYQYWYGPMATGWNVNILNAAGSPPPIIPEPLTMLALFGGLGGLGVYIRKRRMA